MFLGLDLGTSALKAILLDDGGRITASATREYPLHQPRSGWSEQEPVDWWNAARDAIRQLANSGSGPIRAVGLSGQMHGSVFLDRATISRGSGPALRRALLWNDQRTAAECRWIEERAGGRARLVQLVGNAALTGFTLPKIIWVRNHEPDVYKRVAAVILPKDYIAFMLTGRLATDVGDASGVLLLDIDHRTWSDEACRLMGVDPAILPPVFESGAIVGEVTRAAAAETGLAPGIPVVAGSGDNQTGAIGAGIVSTGMVLATLGTSGVIYVHAEEPRRDLGFPSTDSPTHRPSPAPVRESHTPDLGSRSPVGRLHTMCAATGTARAPGQWCVTGCMLSAGGSLKWARETIAPGVPYEQFVADAAGIPPGCEGLVFLPYLTGERCPYPDPDARGGWIGLTSRHTRAHLIRAVLEGVAFGMGQILDLVRSIGVPVDHIRIGGGGARSPIWRQIVADVFGTPVALPTTEEGPALGAAMLAGVGVGAWPTVASAGARIIADKEITAPRDPGAYANARETYAALYPALAAVRG